MIDGKTYKPLSPRLDILSFRTSQLAMWYKLRSGVRGCPRRKASNGHGFDLILDGLNKTVRTDIGSEAKTGKPRGFLRCRADIGKFYKHHAVKPGGYVELQRLAQRKYRLSRQKQP
jgi:hypothetical protein